MGITERIAEIELEISRTQKNKATEYHLGTLKAKLARYRQELLEIKTGSGGPKGEGFDVLRSGDARVALIGFPSVGKSTLLGRITRTESVAAAYEFTTLTCIPGNIEYHGANIQLLDLPGIIEGAAQGKGRGKQVIAVARTADLVLMMLDATKARTQRRLLEAELEAMGIRLNQAPPRVSFHRRTAGGLAFTAACRLTHIDERLVRNVLAEYRIHHADLVVREDITVDQLIDVVVGTRRYLPCLYCYNKIDGVSMEEVDRLAREPSTVVVSCELGLNLDHLKDRIWEALSLLRVYTKRRGVYPDLADGIVMRQGTTIEHVCHAIHRGLPRVFKYALLWGASAKHQPQKVGLQHAVANEDVIQIVKKK